MQLVINTYGAYLHKRENCFLVKTEGKEFEVSAKKVESILISTAAYLSTDAIQLAVEQNIDIVFLDVFGKPFGRVWHSKLGSTALIRRKQLEISDKERGLSLAKERVAQKIQNQMDFLDKLKNPRPDKAETLAQYIQMLGGIKEKLAALGEGNETIDNVRETIMGLEGSAGRIYFEAVSYIMPERFQFDGRSRMPAKDEFNCMLNYGYGVLYSMVEKACILAGLDPYIGFVHADNYNKKSLVFDLIEMYRVWVETVVVYLFSQRKVKKEFFNEIPGGLTLNKEGKVVLIEALNGYLDQSVRYRGRNIKRKHSIQFDCHRIANELIKEVEQRAPELSGGSVKEQTQKE